MLTRVSRIAVTVLVIALTMALWIGGAAQGQSKVPTFEIWGSPASVPPLIVAEREGLFEGVKVKAKKVGYAEEATLFIAKGGTPVGILSPWEAAKFISEGEDLIFFSTAGSIRFFNGMFVQAENYPKPYSSPKDLIGKRLGQPGWGSGTTQALQVIAKALWGIDVAKDYENVVAGPGALMGLLEQGRIEANLVFSGQTLASLASGKFKKIFSFDDAWEAETGQPLVITGLAARTWWIRNNPDVAQRIVEGVDRAVIWMMEHPEEFAKGGKYEDLAEDPGWLQNKETTELVHEFFRTGKYFLTSESYTQEWIDANWKFIKEGKGVLLEELPKKEEVFWSLSE